MKNNKPTYKNIAKHFGIKCYQTVSTWEEKKPLIYETLRDRFLKDNRVANSNTKQEKSENPAK